MNSLAEGKPQSWLVWFLRGILIVGFFILFARLSELQIIKGAYYRDLSEGNRIRRVPITAPRGNVYSRNGELLIGNKEVKKRVTFDPNEGYIKTRDINDAPLEELLSEWERYYPLGSDLAHVSGYLGEVNSEEVGKVDAGCLDKGPRTIGSVIGRGGLEQFYDCTLKGVDGEELVEVDTMGRRIRQLGRKNPIPGQDIHTTLNSRLQKKVASVVSDKKGAVIVSDGTGQVLALYSNPTYDPNVFVQADDGGAIQEILADTNLPLFNRAFGGLYHPGSVFKPVTSIAALEEGAIPTDYTYNDTGLIEVNGFTYRNWYLTQYGGAEGEIGLERALARSTDTFFYKIGELTGVEKLAEWSEKFGLSEKTGIDLPGEIAGLVPDPKWKERIKGEKWFLGNTYHMSIGQGDLAVTPLSINTMTVALINGKLCRPHVIQEDGSSCIDLGINPEHLEIVRNGMIAACSEGGTAFPFFDFKPQAACKTGTAETDEVDKTHAWFTVMAPAENPELVVTILVEKGGEGSRDAAPLAREIFDYHFNP